MSASVSHVFNSATAPAPGTTSAASTSPRPFVKWVGGKRQLLREIAALTPERFGRYFEPFVGGGALFFSLRPRDAFLSDANERLVRTYRAVRDEPESVIGLLSSYPHDQAFYMELRARGIDAASDIEVAAWFIYLNRTGFNGLYRVNQAGRFNVPFGRYANPTICDADNIRACSRALQSATLARSDFWQAEATTAETGDFVYFDPPYVPLSATSSFTAYQAGGFSSDDQRRLRDLAARLVRRGVHVLLSNSSAPLVRELYGAPPFEIHEVAAKRSVNCKAGGRGAVKELLIRGVSS